MSPKEVERFGVKVDVLAARVGTLEKAVTALMTRTRRHDKVLRCAKTIALILLGVGVGSGMVQVSEVMALIP